MQRDYTINRLLAEYLQQNDKKPGAVADRAGIRRDVFSRIIHCRRPIYADELIPILNASGLPMERVIEAVQKSVEGDGAEVTSCRN